MLLLQMVSFQVVPSPPPPDSSFFLIAICSDSAGSCSTESGENNIERQSIYITSVQCLYPLLRVQENPVIVGDDFEWHEDFFYIIYMYDFDLILGLSGLVEVSIINLC